MSLFNFGRFVLHSGEHSNFKIDCDLLTDEDWESLAKLISNSYGFCDVFGVPTGGTKLAVALRKYANPESCYVFIVDDVLTTGKSMNKIYDKVRKKYPNQDEKFIVGIVLFSRIKIQTGSWIRSIFEMKW